MKFGRVLRQLRQQRNIPLRDAARKISVSPGYLSQIERDIAVPSIQMLAKIAEAFGITVGRLVEGAESPATRRMLVRREERKIIVYQGSTSVNELLVPDLKGQLEVILSRIRPGTRSPVYQHAGEEFGFVIKGTLTLWVGEERFDLRGGDAIRFPASMAHHWRKGRGHAEVLWAITPPSW